MNQSKPSLGPAYKVPIDQLGSQDTIQSLKFQRSAGKYFLAVNSWDATARVLEIVPSRANESGFVTQLKLSVEFPCPAVDMRWIGSENCLLFTGGDGVIRLWNLASQKLTEVNRSMQGAIFAAHYRHQSIQQDWILVITLKREFKCIDLKSGDVRRTFNLPEVPLAADSQGRFLVIGFTGTGICLVDLETLLDPDFKFQICRLGDFLWHSICLKAESADIVGGSVDGRVIRANFKKIDFCNQSLLFKAHKIDVTDDYTRPAEKKLFPVNSVGFAHNKNPHIFFTCGSEGNFKIWDMRIKEIVLETNLGQAAKRVCFSAGEMSDDSVLAAVAFGYDWSLGMWGLDTPCATQAGIAIMSVDIPGIQNAN